MPLAKDLMLPVDDMIDSQNAARYKRMTPEDRVDLIFARWGGAASNAFKFDVLEQIRGAIQQAWMECQEERRIDHATR